MPNTIAVIATCFARMHRDGIDYRSFADELKLKKQTKSGGFKKKTIKVDLSSPDSPAADTRPAGVTEK